MRLNKPPSCEFLPCPGSQVRAKGQDTAQTGPPAGDLWQPGGRHRRDTREDYAEHVRAEYSTFRWLLEPMLTAAGLDIVTADFGRPVYGAYTCVKR